MTQFKYTKTLVPDYKSLKKGRTWNYPSQYYKEMANMLAEAYEQFYNQSKTFRMENDPFQYGKHIRSAIEYMQKAGIIDYTKYPHFATEVNIVNCRYKTIGEHVASYLKIPVKHNRVDFDNGVIYSKYHI